MGDGMQTRRDDTSSPDTPILDDATIAFYRCVVDVGVLDPEEARKGLGLDRRQTDEIVERLISLGLLRRFPGDGRLIPARPDVAVSELVRPLESVMRHLQEQTERIRDLFDALMPVYHSSRVRRKMEEESLDVVPDMESFATLVEEAMGRSREEVLVMQRIDLGSPLDLDRILSRDLSVLERGVRLRVMHQHSARYSSYVKNYATALSEAGGRLRTIEELGNRAYVIDREIAFIVREAPSREQKGVVIHQPEVVSFLGDFFEQIWLRGADFAGKSVSRSEGSQIGDELKHVITRLLAEGLRDENIARRIGVSVRTCRRHIAEIMAQIGADSRFQAGYLSARLKLLNPAEGYTGAGGPARAAARFADD